jgi:hypothetical protein
MHPDPASFDHRLKFRRSFEHLQQFKRAEEEWLGRDSHTVRFEHDPKTRDMTFFATVTEQPSADPFSVLIGDCLHNMRSSLDALAYELATKYTKPLPQIVAENSEFPIFGDVNRRGTAGSGASMFRDNAGPKIQGWDPGAKAVVERLQPYQRGNAYTTDPLWVLHELDRINKHRLLHTVAAGANGIGVVPTRSNARIGPGTIEVSGGLVEIDTPVVRFSNVRAADPSREVHVEVTPVLTVAFAKATPGVSEESVYRVLTDLYIYIGTTVFDALEPFLT